MKKYIYNVVTDEREHGKFTVERCNTLKEAEQIKINLNKLGYKNLEIEKIRR